MTGSEREKLDWASDLLKEWNAEQAHQVAYVYLESAAAFSADESVRGEARALLAWATEHGMG